MSSPAAKTVSVLYTTSPGGSGYTPPIFRQKGILGSVGDLCTNPIIGKPFYPQLAYDGYRANIQAFLAAKALGTPVLTSCPTFDISGHLPQPLWPLPRVSFGFLSDVGKEVQAATLAKFEDLDLHSYAASGKTTGYILSPTVKLIHSMHQFSSPHFTPCEGSVCFEAARAHYAISRILSLFLSVNTYAAFSSIEAAFLGSAYSADHNIPISNKRPHSVAQENPHKRRKLVREGSAQSDGREEEDETEPSELTPRESERVITAKVSPYEASYNFGAPSEVPQLPGILFPYFEGLIRPDAAFIRSIVGRHFMHLFGSGSTTSFMQGWTTFRSDVGALADTPQGRVYAHVLLGVELALQTQARLYVLSDNLEYLGFVLLGAGYSINLANSWFQPAPPDVLRAELDKLSTFETRVTAVAKQLERMGLIANPDDISTSADLAERLSNLNFSSDEVKQGLPVLQDMVRHLNYKDRYLQITAENLVEVFKAISIPDPLWPASDMPVYLPPQISVLSDPISAHLLRFGPNAPALWDSKGVQVGFGVETKDAKERLRDSTKRIVLPVARKPIVAATQDWKKCLEERAVKVNVFERAKGNRCIVLKEKQIEVFWDAVHKWNAENPTDSDRKGKKKQTSRGGQQSSANFDPSMLEI